MSGGADRVQLAGLRVYRALPRLGRRWLVRWVAPSYTVGAICVIGDSTGRVLLIRQAYRDRWGLPGGLLKRRELPADGARREVAEEIGVAVELVGAPAIVVEPVPQRIDLVYAAVLAGGAAPDDVRPTSPEISEVAWFPLDALPPLQPETRTAIAALGPPDPLGA